MHGTCSTKVLLLVRQAKSQLASAGSPLLCSYLNPVSWSSPEPWHPAASGPGISQVQHEQLLHPSPPAVRQPCVLPAHPTTACSARSGLLYGRQSTLHTRPH